MDTHEPDLHEQVRVLGARVAILERENRALRRRVLAVVALLAVPLLAAYVPANDRVEASELAVRDKSGATRARIFVDEQGTTRLVLRDKDGKSTAVLSSGDGASLVLTDKSGKTTTALSGTHAKGVVVVEDDGKPRAVLGAPKPWGTSESLDVQDPWATPE